MNKGYNVFHSRDVDFKMSLPLEDSSMLRGTHLAGVVGIDLGDLNTVEDSWLLADDLVTNP